MSGQCGIVAEWEVTTSEMDIECDRTLSQSLIGVKTNGQLTNQITQQMMSFLTHLLMEGQAVVFETTDFHFSASLTILKMDKTKRLKPKLNIELSQFLHCLVACLSSFVKSVLFFVLQVHQTQNSLSK